MSTFSHDDQKKGDYSPTKMYVLYEVTIGDFDMENKDVIAVSSSRETLEIEASRRNANRDYSKDFFFGEWKRKFKVSGKPVKVL